METETKTEEPKKLKPELVEQYENDEEEAKYAVQIIQTINKDLEKREKASLVTNGVPYTENYVYNMSKAINYAPPRDPNEDREVSMGMVHEKVVSFISIFLRYMFKRRFKCFDENGALIPNMGDVYDSAVEFSHTLEEMKKKISLIFWETFTQGNAFVFEDWEVKTMPVVKAYDVEGKEVNLDDVDFTYETLDNLRFEETGDKEQYRRAVSRVLDGRQVILGNPEIEEIQDQPHITIEYEYESGDAEAIFGTLKRYPLVPASKESILSMADAESEKFTLFDNSRLSEPKSKKLAHFFYNKEHNRFNIFLNGRMLLPRNTPLTFYYPRGNYPLSNVAAERLRGSAYARSVPAKTKFNADFLDWVFKNLALKFEQGIIPALLAKSNFTLTRDMFRAGQVTHGITSAEYEKADPENKGVTQAEFSFAEFMKQVIESQTLNPTSSGEITGATATELSLADAGQLQKLGYLLDGITLGYLDMAMRRSETIESKYTIKKRETEVDGEKIPVYQNFTVNMGGVDTSVMWDSEVGSDGYDEQSKRDELFQRSFKDKQNGRQTKYYLVNPGIIRKRKHTVTCEIIPERVKDTTLQLMAMWDEFAKLVATFPNVNREEMQKMYLDVSGRSDKLFLPADVAKLEQMVSQPEQYNTGSMGKPRMLDASKNQSVMNQ